jgi:flagellin
MTTTVNTNTKALFVQQAQTLSQRVLDHAMEQLSTGKRINSASDDAAGVAISVRMAAQVSSLGQAVRNANDGISMLQTADGAAQTVTDLLHRMKELTVQALNETNTSDQRGYLADEFSGLTDRASDIISDTTWNGHAVLALGGSVTFAVGSKTDDTVEVDFADFSGTAAITAALALDLNGATGSFLSDIDDALAAVNSARAEWGAGMNVLAHRADNAGNVAMNLDISRSRIADADYAQATSEMARAQIVQQAGTAMLSQANQLPYLVMALLR